MKVEFRTPHADYDWYIFDCRDHYVVFIRLTMDDMPMAVGGEMRDNVREAYASAWQNTRTFLRERQKQLDRSIV